MTRYRAIVGFIISGGLLIVPSPYVIDMAITETVPWSVPIIVIPLYAVLSYGAFRMFWPFIVQKPAGIASGTGTQKTRLIRTLRARQSLYFCLQFLVRGSPPATSALY